MDCRSQPCNKMVQLRKHKGVPFFDPPRTSTRPPAKIYRGGQSLPLQTGFLPYHLDDNGGTWRILVIESSTCSRWVRLLVDNLPINLHFCILNAHHLWDNFQIITNLLRHLFKTDDVSFRLNFFRSLIQ